jgi:hypothetical protein
MASRFPCAAIHGTSSSQAIYDQEVKVGDSSSPRLGLSGFYASSVTLGLIRVGDPIAL